MCVFDFRTLFPFQRMQSGLLNLHFPSTAGDQTATLLQPLLLCHMLLPWEVGANGPENQMIVIPFSDNTVLPAR